ncbi:hypothetical protein C0995_002265 [Termitomyces sp. Mi166|nr:hypothetical protein C0995_002265 [Termitomyces sp. Mi166\
MFKFIALSVVLAISAFATPLTAGFECGAIAHPDQVAAAQKRISASSVNGTQALKAQGTFNVPVVWNVFYDQNNPQDGNFPDSVITQQNNVMNSFFQPMRLTFTVVSVRRIAVPYNVLHGASEGTAVEYQIKSYHQGDARTLNIYTVGKNPNSRVSGWSSFPWNYQNSPMYDGIIINYDNLPGGSSIGYNTGKESRPLYIYSLQSLESLISYFLLQIMVHEVGHWVGLLHTFEGGCNGGDFVDDTPAEASAADGCPIGRDTCAAPGADPVGQYNRFAQMVYNYRGINLY